MLTCGGCLKTSEELKRDDSEMLQCAGCKAAYYCKPECQKEGWGRHKSACKQVKKAAASPAGFTKKILKAGDGEKPSAGKRVRINYTGSFVDGRQFDASPKDKGFKFILGIGESIRIWDDAVMTMTRGETCRIVSDPSLGFGDRGYGEAIPPNTPLVFELTLLDWEDADLHRTGTNYL